MWWVVAGRVQLQVAQALSAGTDCADVQVVDGLAPGELGTFRGSRPTKLARPSKGMDAVTDALRSLLHACHLLPPGEFAGTVAAHAARLGAREAVLYLADYGQTTLLPLSGAGVPAR